MHSDRRKAQLYRVGEQGEGQDMAKPDAVFIYIGTYQDEAAARNDYDVVKDLHAAGAVGTYDAVVVTRDDAGKVHVNKDEMATRHGAWGGAAVGAVVGAAVGGVGGHLWRGMSRADVKEFGELIDDGQAALVIVGESKLQQAVEKAGLKAEKHVAKELDVSPVGPLRALIRSLVGPPAVPSVGSVRRLRQTCRRLHDPPDPQGPADSPGPQTAHRYELGRVPARASRDDACRRPLSRGLRSDAPAAVLPVRYRSRIPVRAHPRGDREPGRAVDHPADPQSPDGSR